MYKSQAKIGQNCRNFGSVSKVLSDEIFCPPKFCPIRYHFALKSYPEVDKFRDLESDDFICRLCFVLKLTRSQNTFFSSCFWLLGNNTKTERPKIVVKTTKNE